MGDSKLSSDPFALSIVVDCPRLVAIISFQLPTSSTRAFTSYLPSCHV